MTDKNSLRRAAEEARRNKAGAKRLADQGKKLSPRPQPQKPAPQRRPGHTREDQ